MRVIVTHHAIDKAVSDFGVAQCDADSWIRSNYRQARFIANIVSKEGRPSRLFTKNRITFVVARDSNTIITLYPSEVRSMLLRNKVEDLVTRELRKIERQEATTVRRNHLTRLELSVERAACLLRAEKTRSQAVKMAMQARVKAIDEYFAQLDADIENVRHEKRKIAKAVAAYVV